MRRRDSSTSSRQLGPGRRLVHCHDFMLASKPPLASELDPRDDLIEFGLVFDVDEDGTPDHEVGINNSPGGGEYRVWVADLDRGETVEQSAHRMACRSSSCTRTSRKSTVRRTQRCRSGS